jgi:peptidyl-tRNA hydrolase, PTH1 family
MGFLVVKALAEKMGWHFKEDKRFNALVTKGVIGSTGVHLLLPQTYMNLSGTAVRRYLEYFKLPLSCVAIVTDDIALSFGKMRLKTMGSAGGHNGLKSVEAHLGTSHYIRLRMGIGHPGEKVLASYVLDPFSPDELKNLATFVGCGVEILLRLLKESTTQVMNTVNTASSKGSAEPLQKKEPIDLTKPPLQG